jgi:DNA anti-recombination protein RmuC
MSIRHFAVALALASSLALAACGSDEDNAAQSVETAAKQAEEQATPAQARAEIGEVRAALDSAVTSLREGDAKAAENAVSEGYLQHFEKVEGPLEKVDAELNEELEDTIREQLRDKIRSGGSVEEVTKMVSEIKSDLDTAEQKLR